MIVYLGFPAQNPTRPELPQKEKPPHQGGTAKRRLCEPNSNFITSIALFPDVYSVPYVTFWLFSFAANHGALGLHVYARFVFLLPPD